MVAQLDIHLVDYLAVELGGVKAMMMVEKMDAQLVD